MRKPLIVIMILTSTALLGSCTALTPKQISVFDGEQSESDLLPGFVEDDLMPPIQTGSSRLLVEDSGVQYFAALQEDETCLLVVASDEDWAVGCSVNLPIEVEVGEVAARLASTRMNSEEWKAISDNVSIRVD